MADRNPFAKYTDPTPDELAEQQRQQQQPTAPYVAPQYVNPFAKYTDPPVAVLPSDAPQQPQPASSYWSDTPLLNAVPRGVPVVGPYISKAQSAIAAAGASLVPGVSYGQAYDAIEADKARQRAAYPLTNAAGETVGSVGGYAAASRFAPWLLGGNSWAGQTIMGSILGGADAGARNNWDPDAMAEGAAISTLAPTVGRLVSPFAEVAAPYVGSLASKIPGVKNLLPKSATPLEPQQIIQAANDKFDSLGNLMQYHPAAFRVHIADPIRQRLAQMGRAAPGTGSSGADETYSILNSLDTRATTPASLNTVRQQLDNVIASGSKEEAASAYAARDIVNQFLENPPTNAVIQTNPQNYAKAMQVIRDANADWRAARSAQEWDKRVNKADVDALVQNPLSPTMAVGQGLRVQSKQALKDNNADKFLLPNEQDAIKQVQPQTLGQSLLDYWGRMSGTGTAGWGTGLNLLLTAGGGYTGGGPGLAFGLGHMAGGAIGNWINGKLMRDAADRASKVIRANAPASVEAAAQQGLPGYQPINPAPYRDAIARILTLQGQRALTDQEGSGAP